MYPGAFFFSEASSAYVFMIVVNLFVGVTATVTTFILQLFPDDVVCDSRNKHCCFIIAKQEMYIHIKTTDPVWARGLAPEEFFRNVA